MEKIKSAIEKFGRGDLDSIDKSNLIDHGIDILIGKLWIVE